MESRMKAANAVKNYSQKMFLLLAVLFLFLAGNQSISATEFGGGAYPNGAEDFMAGAVPPPGNYFLNYLTYYTADDFTDGKGHTLIPDFKVSVEADVLRFIHVSNTKIFGGYWGMHAFVPLMNVDISAFGTDDNKSGLGDIIVDPFILSWHSKNWHVATGLDIFMPTGAYDKVDIANLSRNYWTFEPIVGVTYVSDNGFDVSAKFMYDINTENEDTDYQSGQELHVDYSIGKKVNNFSFGLGGYYYIQTTDDELNGAKYGDGFRGEVFAIGPEVKFDCGKTSFIFKYQKETASEYRPEGDKFWFKLVHAF
jgi:hypothetical protein